MISFHDLISRVDLCFEVEIYGTYINNGVVLIVGTYQKLVRV